MNRLLLPVLCAGLLVTACSKKDNGDATPPPAAPEAAVPVEATPAPPVAEAPAAAETVSVTKEATVATAPKDVWAKIGDFNGMNTWHPAVAKSEIVTGKNNEPGAQRKLTLADGAAITEELAARDDAAMSLTYTIVESPLPVTDYRSTLSVAADGAGSKITWAGTFKPAAGTEAAKASEIVGGIYQGGLDALAKK